MFKKRTKFCLVLVTLAMLLSLSLSVQAQEHLDGEGNNVNEPYTTDTTLSDSNPGGFAWVTWSELGTLDVNSANGVDDFITTTFRARGEEAYTVSTWEDGVSTFSGDKFVIKAKTTTDDSKAVSSWYGGITTFNNKETVISAKSRSGSAFGIYGYSELNGDVSTVSFATSKIDITAQSKKGDAAGAVSNGSQILFGTGNLRINANGGNSAWGISSQAGSDVKLENGIVDIIAKSGNISAVGIQADASGISFDNAATVASISASVVGEGSAYGAYSGSSGNILFNNIDTTITATSDSGEAHGVDAAFGSKVDFTNNSDGSIANIIATSTSGIAHGVNVDHGQVDFANETVKIIAKGGDKSYSLYNATGIINLNASKTVQLVGDIVTSYDGETYVNLTNADSYLRGLMGEYDGGATYMRLTNGGTWQPTKSFNSINQAHLYINGGVVDLAWWNNQNGNNPANKYRTVTLGTDPVTIGKNGLTLIVNSNVKCNTADKLVIEELSTDSAKKFNLYIQIGYDPILREYRGESGDVLITSLPWTPVFEVLDSAGNIRVNAIGLESVINEGIYVFHVTPHVSTEYGDNGEITSYISYKIDPDIFEPGIHKSLTWAFRTSHDNLWNRVGDIRREPANLENGGVWARFYHSEMDIESKSGAGFSQDYNGIEVGVDNVKFYDDGNLYYGILGNYLNTTEKYELGNGQLSNLHGGLYVTKIYDDGQYYDFVGRAGIYKGQYDMFVAPRNLISGKVYTWMASLSGEYGFRSDLSSDSYVEPQFQLIAGRIGNFDNVTNNGLVAKYGNNDSLIGRFGLNFAKEFKENKVYFTGSVLHDFGKTPVVTVSDGHNTEVIKAENINTWFKAALGANLKMSDDGNAYLEVSRLFGEEINDNVKFIIGARFVF